MSRSRIFQFEPLSEEHIVEILRRAVKNREHGLGNLPVRLHDDAAAYLAKVCDAFNAVQIIGDFVGPVFYQGLGAGRKPTASAVCSDVIDTALGRTRTTFGALNLWSPDRESVPVIEPDAATPTPALCRWRSPRRRRAKWSGSPNAS